MMRQPSPTPVPLMSAENPPFEIAPFRADDQPAWRSLWKRYLAFYGSDVPDTVVDTTWRRLANPAEPMFGFGARRDGALIGIVHFLYHRTTWTIGDYCYLQDLFVADDRRGGGTGRALIEAAAAHARERGASRIYWLTQEGNAVARRLYDDLADLTDFIQYRRLLAP